MRPWARAACAAFLCVAALASSARSAPARRAIVIGINNYKSAHPFSDTVPNLYGALTDAEAMDVILRSQGFEIIPLRDKQASRAAILGALDAQIDRQRAKDGDLLVFFFAGHGSYVTNPTTTEPDHRDETIIPADANESTQPGGPLPFIRDKELASRFNAALALGIRVVAIFDSCHSGSIARGLPRKGRTRFAPPPATSFPEPTSTEKPPEDRGALIFSAAQEDEPAREFEINGKMWGRFTHALSQVLTRPNVFTEPASLTRQRVEATMHAYGALQEPKLAGTDARKRQPLFEQSSAAGDRRPLVGVRSHVGDELILAGGTALGLSAGAQLSRIGGGPEIRLLATEARELGVSKARLVSGRAADLRPGDLFALDRYGQPAPDALRLHLPAQGPRLELLSRDVAEARRLANALGPEEWVADPTEPGHSPTHLAQWTPDGWRLVRTDGTQQPLGARLASQAVLVALSAERQKDPRAKLRLFVNLPLPREHRRAMQLGPGSTYPLLSLSNEPAGADYELVGRLGPNGAEYTWVRPGVESSTPRRGLPPLYAPWLGLGSDPQLLAEPLVRRALGAHKLKAWLTAQSAEPAGRRFPYRLAIRDAKAAQLLPTDAPLTPRGQYELVLTSDAPVHKAEPRFIYVFDIDPCGRGILLYPSSDAQTNRFPNKIDLMEAAQKGAPLPQILKLRTLPPPEPPFGFETLVMVSSAASIPDHETLFTLEGSRARRRFPPGSLAHFLSLLGAGSLRGEPPPVPSTDVEWSVDRLTIVTRGDKEFQKASQCPPG